MCENLYLEIIYQESIPLLSQPTKAAPMHQQKAPYQNEVSNIYNLVTDVAFNHIGSK